MVSTFTPNIGLEEPARGDQVGTWDTPVNANSTLVDLTLGGATVIVLSNANVVLSAAQYKCKTIICTGNLTGHVVLDFPPTFLKSYEIFNVCTGNFVVQLSTGAGNVISAPAGECIEVMNLNGGGFSGMYYKNLGRIGSYVDFGTANIPQWILFNTFPPYLTCDGTTFNGTSYPILAALLGGTTLPDLRGRVRGYLNQGTARINAGLGGVDGNTLLAAGGVESVTLTTGQIPSHAHGNVLNDPGHQHTYTAPVVGINQVGGGAFQDCQTTTTANTSLVGTGITITNAAAGGGSFHTNMPPIAMGGITMIRAG